MTKSFSYYAGLILTIMGLIGIISEKGPLLSRYSVLVLGVVLLLAAYIRRPRK